MGPAAASARRGASRAGLCAPPRPTPTPHEGLTLGTRGGALLLMRGSSALASLTVPGAWRALSECLLNERKIVSLSTKEMPQGLSKHACVIYFYPDDDNMRTILQFPFG